MKKLLPFFLLFFLAIATKNSYAQEEENYYRKNAISFNVTRSAVSELNMSIEHFLTPRKSIEFNGGLIYVNSFLEDQFNNWANATTFSEHGFAGRFHIKTFKRYESNTKWRNYTAPGLAYKQVYYNDMPVVSKEPKLDYFRHQYNESFLRKENRRIIGLEFLWGSVYEASGTFGFEFYYGAGINVTMSETTDHDRHIVYLNPTYPETTLPDFVRDKTYARPYLMLGFKLRLRA